MIRGGKLEVVLGSGHLCFTVANGVGNGCAFALTLQVAWSTSCRVWLRGSHRLAKGNTVTIVTASLPDGFWAAGARMRVRPLFWAGRPQ